MCVSVLGVWFCWERSLAVMCTGLILCPSFAPLDVLIFWRSHLVKLKAYASTIAMRALHCVHWASLTGWKWIKFAHTVCWYICVEEICYVLHFWTKLLPSLLHCYTIYKFSLLMCETFYGCSFKAAVTAELILKIVKINEINETSISLVSIHWYKFFIFFWGGLNHI